MLAKSKMHLICQKSEQSLCLHERTRFADYCNVKKYVCPFLLLRCKTAVTFSPVVNPCCQLLFDNVLQAILFAAMLQRPATVNATADHMEILDAGAQQGLLGECGPERVQVMESGEKNFWMPCGSLKKNVCARVPPRVTKLLRHLSFPNSDVYVS